MTKTAQKLVSELETVLEQLPEEEQEERVSSYLADLHQRVKGEKHDQQEDVLYEPFQLMLNADLDMPSDYSETYEERLYGIHKRDD